MQNHFTFINQEIPLCGTPIANGDTSDDSKDITCSKCEKRYYDLLESLEDQNYDDQLFDSYESIYN